jgi:hypothetical protein
MRRRTLWLVILACAVPRLAALAVFRDPARTLYLTIADNLVARHAYAIDDAATSYIEPFYPLLLAAGRLIAGRRDWLLLVMPIAVACGGGAALFALTRARLQSARAAWIAVALYAVSPYLVRQAASFMEVTVACALAIAVVWSIDRVATVGDAALASLAIAALILTRLSFLPIAAGAVAIVARRNGPVRGLILAAALFAAVMPWLVFSRTVSGTLLPPRLGENLFVSTSTWAVHLIPATNVDVLLPLTEEMVGRELGPSYSLAARDRLLLQRALDYVRTHPRQAVALKVRNLGCVLLPRLLPFTERRGSAEIVDGRVVIPPQAQRPLSFELAAGGFQLLLLCGGAAGIWKRRYHLASDDASLLLVAASVVAVNVIFFPTSRLLAPMTFVPMFYAAAAVPDRTRRIVR